MCLCLSVCAWQESEQQHLSIRGHARRLEPHREGQGAAAESLRRLSVAARGAQVRCAVLRGKVHYCMHSVMHTLLSGPGWAWKSGTTPSSSTTRWCRCSCSTTTLTRPRQGSSEAAAGNLPCPGLAWPPTHLPPTHSPTSRCSGGGLDEGRQLEQLASAAAAVSDMDLVGRAIMGNDQHWELLPAQSARSGRPTPSLPCPPSPSIRLMITHSLSLSLCLCVRSLCSAVRVGSLIQGFQAFPSFPAVRTCPYHTAPQLSMACLLHINAYTEMNVVVFIMHSLLVRSYARTFTVITEHTYTNITYVVHEHSSLHLLLLLLLLYFLLIARLPA